jgi:CheY-like chemotaxis protein
MLNLAVNARDAMPAGGKLTITTGRAMVGADGAQAHPEARPGPHVFVETSDNGVGIPPEILPRIFDPFFTTKDVGKGTGLGLATVFGIVKQHGGWIHVRSNPGHGTTFRIHLPLHEPTEKPEQAPPAAAIPLGGNETILVTEDEPSLRSLICQILQRGGYQVIEAANCASAMDAWREAGGRISLLLTDIVMPGGMTGMQLATRLRGEDPGLRIILMTGYSVDFSGLESEMPESAKFLQKPFVPDQLLATVAQALGK